MTVRRVMGTECEYGVAERDSVHYNPVECSFAVVEAAADEHSRHIHWDYRQEDPVNDMRGTRLDRASAPSDILTDDPQLMITNVIAPNGGRIYVDHAHPEYSSPECTEPFSALAYSRAGDLLMQEAAARARVDGHEIMLTRNNTDGKGASWGTHENYLMSRAVPVKRLADLMTTHFVTRQIYTGSGHLGIGEHSEIPGYQLTQRADFFHMKMGLQTTFDRPIINTRDESHAPDDMRRLHVIVGDANRMDVPEVLKLGVTSMLLWVLEVSQEQEIDISELLDSLRLADPVEAMHAVSHDLTLGGALPLASGNFMTAWEIQLHLRSAVYEVAAMVHGTDTRGEPLWPDKETRSIMAMWEQALLDVAHVRHANADERLQMEREASRLEWLLKWQLIEKMRRRLYPALPDPDGATGTAAQTYAQTYADPRLAGIELRWAELDTSRSLVNKLRSRMESVVSEQEVRQAASEPPTQTRAWLRAEMLKRFGSDLIAASWSHLAARTPSGGQVELDMRDPLTFTQAACKEVLDGCADIESAMQRLSEME